MEHEEYFLAELTDQLVEYSPDWAVQILARVEHEYDLIAKTANDTMEFWYIPVLWASGRILPIAYQSIPKEWISYPGAECFIAPLSIQQ
jgi:hypothetical protein